MKKLLLFLTIILLGTQVSTAQVPVNDLIQNATLVNESPFVENNVRLDLATSSSGGQTSCNTADFKVVYYKFTAQTNATINILVEDDRDPIGNFFAILYSAPDLNATSDTQLSQVSGCNYGNTSGTITAGTTYYLLVHRETGAFTKITIDIAQSVPDSESTILSDIYNNTDGQNWTNQDNWNSTDPVSSWHGVTVKNENISKIVLINNNLIGSIPASISNLQNLEEVNFSFNKLSGEVPDLSTISTLNSLDLNSNDFSFQDLETNYSGNSSLQSFKYQTQNLRDTEDSFDGILGDDYTLTMTPIPGTNVQYQWYKKRYNYFDKSDEIIPGATSNTYVISGLTEDDMDVYICRATSSTITDLTIERNSIEIKGEVSQLQKDALIAIYNSTNGDNWNNNTNWLSAEPISTWHGVTVTGNKVTKLDFYNNNLTGTLPPEIGNLTGLEWLSFYFGNSINGALPPEIGNLTELRVLSFEINNFTGEIPPSYSNLTKLRGLWLYNNQLSGNVPEFINTFTNLVFCDISQNSLSGTLPDFTGLSKLTYLKIDNNHFVPNDFSDQFNDYLNLENSWSNSSYYSPQFTLDVEEELSGVEGDDITLTLTDIPDTNRIEQNKFTANAYQWFKDNIAITGAIENSYTITNSQISDSGIYYCEITNPDIPDLIIKREIITVNIGSLSVDDELQKAVRIYPNPSISSIKISLPQYENITASLFDMRGRLILKTSFTKRNEEINISHLQVGLYMLRIEVDDKIALKKIIKQ